MQTIRTDSHEEMGALICGAPTSLDVGASDTLVVLDKWGRHRGTVVVKREDATTGSVTGIILFPGSERGVEFSLEFELGSAPTIGSEGPETVGIAEFYSANTCWTRSTAPEVKPGMLTPEYRALRTRASKAWTKWSKRDQV